MAVPLTDPAKTTTHHEPTALPNAADSLRQLDDIYKEIPRQQVDFQLQNLQKSIQRQRRFFPHVGVANLTLRDPLEAKIASDFFAQLFPDTKRAKLGILELLMNAIEHGNLGITSEEKHTLLAQGGWMKEITNRLSDPANTEKRVHIYCYRDINYIKITIRDDGGGFNWQPYIQENCITPYHQLSGRGITAAKHIGFDEFSYTGKGNVAWGLQYRN